MKPKQGVLGFLASVQGRYPFHMPGHKRNPAFAGAYAASDITEIDGADNLQAPSGIIAALQEQLAALYGADESYVLVNGSTVGIEAALLYCAGKVIMARNSHRSAYGGLVLAGGAPAYLYPDLTSEGLAAGVSPQAVAAALDAAPDAQAVYITSPTYEGYCSDIARIAALAHARGKLLIVDEAHGAHFGFHPAFPCNASRLGADIAIQSLHKTLPAPGQCAVMHRTGGRVDAKRLRACVNLLQTASPSYFFLSEIERCVRLLQADGERLFAEYVARLARFREEAMRFSSVRLLTGGDGYPLDPGKLVFDMRGALDGVAFGQRLRERGVELEMCLPTHAVAMTSIADTDEGFARLIVAVGTVDGDARKRQAAAGVAMGLTQSAIQTAYAPSREATQAALTPRAAFFADKRVVSLDEAAGMTAGDFIIPYPPGIPLVVPGETITEEMAREAGRLMAAGVEVLGAEEVVVTI